MDRQDLDTLRSAAELQDYQKEVRGRVTELNNEFVGLPFSEEAREEVAWLDEDDKEIDKRVAEFQGRERMVARYAQSDAHTETTWSPPSTESRVRDENIYDLSTVRGNLNDLSVQGRELRERARKAVDLARFLHPLVSEEDAKSRVERMLHRDSEDGLFARYLLSVGSPTYKRAWPKVLTPNGMGMLTREEQMAVSSAQMAERALNLTGAQGGFAVPFELDPTILNTSNGVVNPIRSLARVRQITVDEWRGVTSAGITASYAAEATETTDNAPTLAQPTVSTEKAQAFVPFSIEIGMDWGSIQEDMSELLQDAKDTLEAAKFISGTGTNEPFGVAVGTTNTVNATSPQNFTLSNLYSLKNALPPRYRGNGAFIADSAILDRVRQFDTVGSSAAIWVDSLQEPAAGRLLGKNVFEASEMPDAPATSAKFMIFGDFSRYLIVDRIGLNVELIPHLMGANRRPTGERGLYAYWRNGAKVIDANAFRALLGVV